MKKSTKNKRQIETRKTLAKTVSLPPLLIEQAEAQATRDRRTFSNYVAWLIEADGSARGSNLCAQ